jgi:2-phospho-L-lactate/phosphoenolpyruvate guanylyltransferase
MSGVGHVVIAVRGGPAAKSRLSDQLDGQRRDALVAAMLSDMLIVLRSARRVHKIWVVTPTSVLANLAAKAGASVVPDRSSGDLNCAFEQARARIAAEAPDATALLLPGDLPRLAADEVEDILLSSSADSVVIARTSADGGTGALALSAASQLPLGFGPQSFARHLAAATAYGLHARTLEAPGLSLDIDRPADIDRLLILGAEGRTGELLRHWKAIA